MLATSHRAARLQRLLLAFLVLCVLVHLALAARLGLSVDEAHYALYATHPALSYFDHPPLVGWLQMPFVWLGQTWQTVAVVFGFGDATVASAPVPEIFLRLLPLLCWGLTLWGLWRISCWAALLFGLSPLHHVLGLAMVPDTLLMPITAALLLLLQRMRHGLRTSPSDLQHDTRSDGTTQACRPAAIPLKLWLLLGLLLGLAGLSKYTAVLLAFGAAAYLIGCHGWALLRERGVWLAAAVAAICVSPVMVWNAQHDWMSFTYQLGHAGGNQTWRFSRVAAYALLQWPLVSLLVGFVGAWAVWRTFRSHDALLRSTDRAEHHTWQQLGLCLGLPTLLLICVLAGRGSALPHWTAPAWIALFPMLGALVAAAWAALKSRVWLRFVAGLLIGLQLLLLLVIAVLLWRGGSPSMGQQVSVSSASYQRGNPFADVYGWQAAGSKAVRIALDSAHAQNTSQPPALVVANWTLASRLAWYAQPLAVKTLDDKNQQFPLWFGRLLQGDNAVFVNWSQMPFDLPLRRNGHAGFARCDLMDTTTTPWPNDVSATAKPLSAFQFYQCEGWKE